MIRETGSFITMTKLTIKILTLALACFSYLEVFASSPSFSQNKAQSHLRWNIQLERSALSINKSQDEVSIKSLNPTVLRQIYQQMSEHNVVSTDYIEAIELVMDDNNFISEIKVSLVNNEIEVFSFFVDRDKRHVIDFWSSHRELLSQALPTKETHKTSEILPPIGRKDLSLLNQQEEFLMTSGGEGNDVLEKVKKVQREEKTTSELNEATAVSKYRDFRYGASFLWDYPPLVPRLELDIDITRRTPDHFFPIADRDFEKNEREAHLQLMINLYRRRNFGLMYKAINLFEEKYGHGSEYELIEYLKANALLRDSLNQGHREPVKTAVSMFSNIAGLTDNYELEKAIHNYLLSYYFGRNDYIKTLEYAKKSYVSAQENFDFEFAAKAVEIILHALSRLGQIEEVKALIEDRDVKRLTPDQIRLAYKYYTFLSRNEYKEVITHYESIRNSLSRPIHPSISFNVAESYFRDAQYQESLDMFDYFIAEYSHSIKASHAYLRLAQNYDLLNNDFYQTLELYRNAINRATDSEIINEARIRYSAMASLRKKMPSKEDLELRVLLDFSQGASSLSFENQKLLWLVRLRNFIVDGKYQEALSYLKAVPMNRLSPLERRVFQGDGAEAIYAMIVDHFKNSSYGEVVKIWEVYKDQYIDKVAKDSFINFIVAKSFLRLGLLNQFDRVIANFKEYQDYPMHSFPIWIEREEMNSPEAMIAELEVARHLKLENFAQAQQSLDRLAQLRPDNDKQHFYQGLISYAQNQYSKAINSFEKYLGLQGRSGIYDPNDVAEMLLAYTDSLYQQGAKQRFLSVAPAILQDVANFAPEHGFMHGVRERISYLYIDVAQEKEHQNKSYRQQRMRDFLAQYPDGQYSGRVGYMLGMSFVADNRHQEGLDLFQSLLDNPNTSEHIREMAQSEIALLKIKNRNL